MNQKRLKCENCQDKFCKKCIRPYFDKNEENIVKNNYCIKCELKVNKRDHSISLHFETSFKKVKTEVPDYLQTNDNNKMSFSDDED